MVRRGHDDAMTSPTDDRLADRLMDRRIVVLGDEVTDESANRVVSQLLVLSADDAESDISLYINSPGGSVLAGLAIYDVMQLVPNDVATVAIGLAASMGQVLLCGGAPGKRFALPNAQVLMHEGSAGLGGAAADVEIQAAHLMATLDRMRSIVARHTGRPLEQVIDDVGRDRWFDAGQARDYGFVDRVVDSLDEIRPSMRSRAIGLAAAAWVGTESA
jgi:ATP-dependent Clp protease protease subunit